MKIFIKFLIIITVVCMQQVSFAGNMCSNSCCFDVFFRENYKNLLEYLCPDTETKKFYDILFNAYSIKFKGFDYEYESTCKEILDQNDECKEDRKKYLKSVIMMAMDEYDSFLDDLNFELCEDETLENPIIKKNKKKYRKQIKKSIAKNCK